ncbi:50S ribosomal protein L29 [Candidatus Woesearchaeota archaeon]|nr:50S ribosomal protein L29 [Candidatus Woesearchaeota archaeon]MBW3021524.1 50S ribosomal protein L29 [Candidatus Woesearchaeota archaeon]
MPKKKELAGMTKQDLLSKMDELKKELIKENAQVATGTVPKNPGQIKAMKKTIARIITILKNEEA